MASLWSTVANDMIFTVRFATVRWAMAKEWSPNMVGAAPLVCTMTDCGIWQKVKFRYDHTRQNTMYGYADKLDITDRWAVIAYVRALQRSQNGAIDDVPASHKAELN